MEALANYIPDETLLRFPSDVPTRRLLFTESSFSHPAKLHLGLLQWILDRYTAPGDTILDPMAGSGSILLAATEQRHVIARDVEPAYLTMMHENAAHILRACGLFAGSIDVGAADAREPWGVTADHIIMSPPYACRASASRGTRVGILSHKMRAGPAATYGERWQRFLERPSTGGLGAYLFHYGEHPAQVGHLRSVRYWDAMRAVYVQAHAALRPGGFMVLVIKNHVKHGKVVPVVEDTIALCESLGFRLAERHGRLVHPMSLWTRRRKERGELVVEVEDVLVFGRVV